MKKRRKQIDPFARRCAVFQQELAEQKRLRQETRRKRKMRRRTIANKREMERKRRRRRHRHAMKMIEENEIIVQKKE